MRLGLYTFAALAFIGLVAGFVYTVAPGNHVLEFAGLDLNLPIALWVVLPLLILLLLTILHMLYHGTRNYFVRRKWQRDIDTMDDAMYWSLIHEPKEHNYTIPQISEGASILSGSALNLLSIPQGINPKLAKTAEWIKQINDNEYVDLKKLKVQRFMSKENPLLIKNFTNKLEADPSFADEILKNSSMYAKELFDKAVKVALNTQTMFKLKQYADKLDFDEIEILLDRADAGEDIGFSLDMLESFIGDKSLTCAQYMRVVSSAIEAFDPDTNIAFFKKLAKNNPNAQAAYLFLLFRYEMIEKAENFLDEQEEDEFVAFRAFLTLKKSKYNYKVRDFISADNACR